MPYELNQSRFNSNPINPMLYQMHAQRYYEMVLELSDCKGQSRPHIQEPDGQHPDFALWIPRSMAAIVIPQPEWDFSDMMPAFGGYVVYQDGGYQDRRGWGPPEYMQFT